MTEIRSSCFACKYNTKTPEHINSSGVFRCISSFITLKMSPGRRPRGVHFPYTIGINRKREDERHEKEFD